VGEWVSPLFLFSLFIGHMCLISFACIVFTQVFTVVPFTSCVYCPGVPVPELVVPAVGCRSKPLAVTLCCMAVYS
jgi:hypothetical protein